MLGITFVTAASDPLRSDRPWVSLASVWYDIAPHIMVVQDLEYNEDLLCIQGRTSRHCVSLKFGLRHSSIADL